MKKPKKPSEKKSIAFQSDIIIDEDGEVFISFLGPELLHLIDSPSFEPMNNTSLNLWSSPIISPDTISEHEYKKCNLCPRSCGFDRTNFVHPLCGDNKLRVSNFGISFGDEIFLSGGGGSGVIFLSGCPLTCPSCINKEKVHTQGTEVSPNDFIEFVSKLHSKNVSNIQILSPTVHLPALRPILKALKDTNFPIPIALKTAGHDLPEQIELLDGLVDIYIPDLKPCFNFEWSKKSKIENNYQFLFEETINIMFAQVGTPSFTSSGNIQKGVVIRYVRPPFLTIEQERKTLNFLYSYQDRAHISILDNYVSQEVSA